MADPDLSAQIDKIVKLLRVAESAAGTPQGAAFRAAAERKMVELGLTEELLVGIDADWLGDGATDGRLDLVCVAYTLRTGQVLDPALLSRRVDDAIDVEHVRARGLYLGRCGTREGAAQDLARVHMEVFEPVFTTSLRHAVVDRLLGRHTGLPVMPAYHALPRPLCDMLGGGSSASWAQFHLQNGWAAGHKVADVSGIPKVPQLEIRRPT